MNRIHCEGACEGKWCTNEPLSTLTIPSEPQETCGNGNRGNGICLKVGECCNQYGWCGVTSEHCGFTPAAAPFGDDHNQNNENVTGTETLAAGMHALTSPPPTPTETV
jgi:hypothetical protein